MRLRRPERLRCPCCGQRLPWRTALFLTPWATWQCQACRAKLVPNRFFLILVVPMFVPAAFPLLLIKEHAAQTGGGIAAIAWKIYALVIFALLTYVVLVGVRLRERSADE